MYPSYKRKILIKQKRSKKDGSFYYSFLYTDSKKGKRVRMSQDYIRQRFGKKITTKEEASKVIKILAADYESLQDKMRRRAA